MPEIVLGRTSLPSDTRLTPELPDALTAVTGRAHDLDLWHPITAGLDDRVKKSLLTRLVRSRGVLQPSERVGGRVAKLSSLRAPELRVIHALIVAWDVWPIKLANAVFFLLELTRSRHAPHYC